MAGDDEITGGTIYQFDSDSKPVQISNWNWSTTASVDTPNVSWGMTDQKYPSDHKEPERNIHPRLYFKYIKSKMSVLEFSGFKRRMKYLEKLTDEFAKNGQVAMSEDCIKKFIVVSRESAAYACGIKTFVTQETLDKFKNKIKVPIKYTNLRNFARVIPPATVKKIRACMTKKLFDDYIVVHVDNKDAVKETEQERVSRERDPICFGRVNYSEKYYFICDWVDELDNLRLETIVKALKLDKGKMKLRKDISKEDLK